MLKGSALYPELQSVPFGLRIFSDIEKIYI